MVSTRSKTAQSHLEDFGVGEPGSKTSKSKAKPATTKGQASSQPRTKGGAKAVASAKRKTPNSPEATAPKGKQAKTTASIRKDSPVEDDGAGSKIIINRAPVLQLWGACVTRTIYPDLEWESCFSTGSAISTICAVAKGRSIGTIAEPDDSNEKLKKKDVKEKQKDLDAIEVMHFKLKLKDGLAVVGNEQKGKPAGEEALERKFGEDQYERARNVFYEMLEQWKGDEDELNKEAFKFYEEFRPNVSSGQKGWGRNGELDLDTVRKVLAR